MFEVIEKATGKRVYWNEEFVRCEMWRYWTPEDSDEPSKAHLYETREVIG